MHLIYAENYGPGFTLNMIYKGQSVRDNLGNNIPGHGIFFMGVGQYYISLNFGRGGGQFFRGYLRILLHFYYQIFSENLGWGVGHPGGGILKGG